MKKNKKQKEFSKTLLVQESILIWILSIAFVVLAYICVFNQFFGELPWLAAMIGFPWGAYGISQGFYYKKAMSENTKNGIKYEATLASLNDSVEDSTIEENAVG